MSSEFRISLNALVGFSIIFDNYKQSLVMENSGLIEKQDMSPPALKKIKMQENNAPGTATVSTPSNPISIPTASFNARYALTLQQNLHLNSQDDMQIFQTRQMSKNQNHSI